MTTNTSRLSLEGTPHLRPGFLVTYAGLTGIKYPNVHGTIGRRAQPATVRLVAQLSKPDGRSLQRMISDVTAITPADPALLGQLVDALDDAGYLADAPAPAPYENAVPSLGDQPMPAASHPLQLRRPTSLLVERGSFLWFDHDGILRARLSADEVLAAALFSTRRSTDQARAQHDRGKSNSCLDVYEFEQLVHRLVQAGMLRQATPGGGVRTEAGQSKQGEPDRGDATRVLVEQAIGDAVEAHDSRAADDPRERVPVVPVNTIEKIAPASLGLLVAHAMTYREGRLQDRYSFVPLFYTDDSTLLDRASGEPSIFLFSNYVWNLERNLQLSALAKRANPENVTIHGGPSTPKYEQDVEQFFAEHGHVDVTVRGEGEATLAALLDALDTSQLHCLDPLSDVCGLSFRTAGGVETTEDRERIVELDTIPSPYLLGLFDPFGATRAGAIIETNRGCPYGCTFCDWGSATLSRIRKFSLDRVFAELEWCARNQIEVASIADANFGIIERDVEIAQKIADLKREYGFPRTVATNYAKNTVKHLRQIIEILADVEILTEGVVSLQSMDKPTLQIIRRSNIKLEKYNELSTEFRRTGLPLAADIMMGLPGSTPTAFRNDLQQCTNRDVRVRANPTQLLPNSPMNEPTYRLEHGITAKPGELLTETASYTRAEWDEMDSLRRAYYIFDNWGVLRYVARHLRRELDLHEVDFYDRVQADALADSNEWPIIATTLRILENFMAPPGSWGLFVSEVHRYVTTKLDVPDDSALGTALQVQRGHLPAPDRAFPVVLNLAHDFRSWQDELLAARENGHREDWETVVRPLGSYPPAELTIHDPNDICSTDVGKPMAALAFALRSWELDSPVARPRLGLTVAAS